MPERKIGKRDDFGEGKIGRRNSEKFELTYSETKREIIGRREKRRPQKEFWGLSAIYRGKFIQPNQNLPRGRIFCDLKRGLSGKSGTYDVVLEIRSRVA
ncbi:LOW QUALITY PROTEIN: hypothetical protein TorRG33x02_072750 [Trema orientale]|uniref:Uncharacterized protein n=1 Tax=Trema orientale TaxID=63057 RepID=A0A2P5FGK3_TREOI|nr:LOW QUALITY PROTEIN: hypothetical protein TorRG33x02_072750 [Trema orientale]